MTFFKDHNRAGAKLTAGVIAGLLVFGIGTSVAFAGGTWNGGMTESEPNAAAKDSTQSAEKETAKTPVRPAADCNKAAAFSKIDLFVDGKKVPTLGGGQVSQGSTVKVDFEIAEGCENVPVALVSYEAVEGFYTDSNVEKQTYHDSMSGRFSNDGKVHSMSVEVPDCFFQVDFATDKAYKQINSRTYLGTLVEADTGGMNTCAQPKDEPKPTPKPEKPSETAPPTTKAPKPECPEDVSSRITNYSGFNFVKGTLRGANGESVSTNVKAKVTFTVAEGCRETLTLASYKAESKSDTKDAIAKQTYFDHQTKTVGPGEHTLTVDLPECIYQLDFVRGDVIKSFGPADSDNYYWDQGRLLSSTFGGEACPEPVTEVKEETVVRAQPKQQAKQPELAATGSDSISLTALGSALTVGGIALLVAARRFRNENAYWVD